MEPKLCPRCGNPVPNDRYYDIRRYCSHHCGILFLKAGYKKRNHKKITEYHRSVRLKQKKNKLPKELDELREFFMLGANCIRCGTTEKLHIHHIRPRSRGGKDTLENLTILCSECHLEWHKVIPNFYWDKYAPPDRGSVPR